MTRHSCLPTTVKLPQSPAHTTRTPLKPEHHPVLRFYFPYLSRYTTSVVVNDQNLALTGAAHSVQHLGVHPLLELHHRHLTSKRQLTRPPSACRAVPADAPHVDRGWYLRCSFLDSCCLLYLKCDSYLTFATSSAIPVAVIVAADEPYLLTCITVQRRQGNAALRCAVSPHPSPHRRDLLVLAGEQTKGDTPPRRAAPRRCDDGPSREEGTIGPTLVACTTYAGRVCSEQ
ncbi:hypothetical protein B0T22DRAFT_267108 [Podospora appendiculata]|uniref:Uncharacterized protein n=1 Tax=Podospora appendiculata TaxID=314037 RepID=A0AAE0X3C0_9PEZI|nr:hypothetical protein B0T22DRAFT_267108 [Podospora appendiculata]